MSGASAGPPELDPALLRRVRTLAPRGRRTILGITGPPGAGKSTLAHSLVAAVGADARLVAMDGFHLAEAELHRLGRHDRKGAPDTFDAAGYVALLRRLRSSEDAVVYAPWFDRENEEPVAGAVPVPREVPLVITEGNYLLASGAWAAVRPLLDECWYVDPGESERITRLVARHQQFGRSLERATERTMGSDQRNARIVAATRGMADLIVCDGAEVRVVSERPSCSL